MNFKKRAQDIFDIGAEPIISTAAGIVLSGVAGTIVPGVVSAMMNYRQVRTERNVERFMLDVKKQLGEIDARMERLDEEGRNRAQEVCLPIALDYAAGAKQHEKIQYIVNGFVNASMDTTMTDDFQLMYYDTLDQLSVLELRVLRMFYSIYSASEETDDSAAKIMDDYGLDDQEYKAIRTTLARHGLLAEISKNDEKFDKMIDEMQKSLEQLTGGSKKIDRYRKVRMPLIDRLSYRITPHGRRFMAFFTE